MSAGSRRHANQRDSLVDATSDANDIGDDEDKCSTTKTIDSCDLDNIFDDIGAEPEAEDASISSNEGSEVIFLEESTEQIATGEEELVGEDGGDSAHSEATQAKGGGSQRPLHGRSIVHGHLNNGRIIFLSLDLETGGEKGGIIQLSAEFVRPKLIHNPQGTVFDEYAQPSEDATAVQKVVLASSPNLPPLRLCKLFLCLREFLAFSYLI